MSDYKKQLAIGAIAAGIIGYGIGLLTATKSGKDTRDDIKRGAINTTKHFETSLKSYHSEITELVAEAKIKGLSYKGKAKEELKKLTDSAIEARHRISLALTALHEGDRIDEDLEVAISEATESIDKLNNFVSKEKDNN